MGEGIKLPRRVVVKELLSGRYAPGSRPVSWDDRKEGFESIVTEDGETILLASNGGQSTPTGAWELLLTNQIESESGPAYSWTLYGVAPA
jgi:hypothetical protein